MRSEFKARQAMRIWTAIIFLTLCATAHGSQTVVNPVEVGTVQWGRNFDAALKMSAESGKPVLVLFQEVPG
ncbi:MAG: hypothetical protein QNI89_09415 [Desulfobacterales bacterium]|nr:hypothetical protein [Desulfobacterales bacterium]MDJ0855423.1 hypothetical protein [Desulfobacterales bacterium]MDJ0887508.1 hypothetical protein [Desulfobacterales bacterium]